MGCRSQKVRLPTALQLHASLTVTQQDCIQRHCRTRLQSGSDPELVVSKRTFLCRSGQDIHFKEVPGSFRRLSRRPHASPRRLCCTIGFPSRGQVLSLSCHRLAQQENCSTPEQVACICWTEQRLLGNGQGLLWPPEQWCGGGGKRACRSVCRSSRAGVWGPLVKERLRDLQGWKGPVKFNQQPICQMGKLRPGRGRGLAKAAQ